MERGDEALYNVEALEDGGSEERVWKDELRAWTAEVYSRSIPGRLTSIRGMIV